MLNRLPITPAQRTLLRYWLPALLSGGAAFMAFILLGHTPFVRALALAATISGVTLALRRFGGTLALIGGLAMAFSPAFWSQTGGEDSATLMLIALLLAVAAVAGGVFIGLGRKPSLGMAVGLVVFALLFWGLVGTPRSLRITTLLSAWLIYLLIDALLTANPRPDEPPSAPLYPRHLLGILVLLTLGILNDPLFTLLAPAVVLTLLLSKTRLPIWYWAVIGLMVIIGLRGVAVLYMDSGWWLYPAEQAEAFGIRVPFMMADGWREASRWLYLFGLVIGQFSIVGVLLGAFGLARLSRWYPPLGTVTMVAYAAYAIFGLVYFGRDSVVLLMPLLIIQAMWMTYAVHSFSHWLQKSFSARKEIVRWLAPAAFTLLPLFMLFRITGVL
ncbi:MAG: hypothetical protein K8L97_13265 [Anaerolineae bacterium]|nr:hypothetical protein [Anaerolineae bacterium]